MKTFALVAAGVFWLDILVPPIVLSLARKPVDFFTFNPWLKRSPSTSPLARARSPSAWSGPGD
jgi:hypothetical protein